MRKIEVSVSVNKETKEKVDAVMKEIGYGAISVVSGALVGSVIGATIQKAGHYSKPANVVGNLAGLGITYATSMAVYDSLKESNKIRRKQLELLDANMVEDELLDDEEEGDEEEA